MRVLKLSLLSLMLIPFAAMSAVVPDGVKLAKVQEIVRDIGAEPASLDPQKVEGSPGGHVIRDLFEGLVNQDADGNTIPGQAESWTMSPDNKVFTFNIRKDAKWSDGSSVTAHDFVYGFQRAVDPATGSRYGWYIEIPTIINASDIIKGEKEPASLGVKALDDHTFEVTLEQPVPYFIKMLAHFTTFPAPKSAHYKTRRQLDSPRQHVVQRCLYPERVDGERQNCTGAQPSLLER